MIADSLLRWFDPDRRPMPWRGSADPYRVWVSEIMLQQTQVATAIPFFERFMARFPSVRDLAEAPVDDVLKAWEGLGYYSRARNMHRAAQRIAEAGPFPDDFDGLRSLPGIGDYTAGAVLSIAFGKPYPAVDGNVLRVYARLHALESDVSTMAAKRQVEDLVRRDIPSERAGDFNQALFDLGATICMPASPHCGRCPIAQECAAHRDGTVDRFPIKRKKAPPREVRFGVAVLRAGDWLALVQRPSEGLLGGLWEFPNAEGPELEAAERTAVRLLGEAPNLRYLTAVSHTYSHMRAHMHVYEAYLSQPLPLREGRWVRRSDLERFALSRVNQAIAQSLDRLPLFQNLD